MRIHQPEPVPLDRFDCYVLSVEPDGSFWARISDPTGAAPEMEALVLATAVTEADRPLLQNGAYFDWDVYEGENRLTFKRLPVWTEANQAAAQAWADSLPWIKEQREAHP